MPAILLLVTVTVAGVVQNSGNNAGWQGKLGRIAKWAENAVIDAVADLFENRTCFPLRLHIVGQIVVAEGYREKLCLLDEAR